MRSSTLLMAVLVTVTLSLPRTAHAQALEEIVITAQKREKSLQDTSLSVAVFSGENIAKDRNLSFSDLARSITGFSYTGNSNFDQELNIRGITNTRLDAPSADQSVGIFVDGVYIGRPGLLNADMFDVERVEVIRGPQGVVLGKNVVGGALSIISKAPEQKRSGSLRTSFGNFSWLNTSGYITGGLTKGLTGRLSFQTQNRDGYARDVLNNRDMEDLDSRQARAQLLWEPDNSDLRIRLIIEAFEDDTNGPLAIPLEARPAGAAGRAAGLGPWSIARRFYTAQTGRTLSIREAIPFQTTLSGHSRPTLTGATRKAVSGILDVQYYVDDHLAFNSLIGYRSGRGFNFYDQTGISIESLLQAGIPLTDILNPNDEFNLAFLFREPVFEREKAKSITSASKNTRL